MPSRRRGSSRTRRAGTTCRGGRVLASSSAGRWRWPRPGPRAAAARALGLPPLARRGDVRCSRRRGRSAPPERLPLRLPRGAGLGRRGCRNPGAPAGCAARPEAGGARCSSSAASPSRGRWGRATPSPGGRNCRARGERLSAWASSGADTLVGRAVVRWAALRRPSRSNRGWRHSDLHWGNLARYRIVTRREREDWFGPHGPAGTPEGRVFRIVAPGTAPGPGERLVERIVEPWGCPVASVLSVPGGAGGSRDP